MPSSCFAFACSEPEAPPCPVGRGAHPCQQDAPDALVVVEALPLCRSDEGAERLLLELADPAESVQLECGEADARTCRTFAVMPCEDAFRFVARVAATSCRG